MGKNMGYLHKMINLFWTKFCSSGRSETLTFNAGTLGGKVATAVTILKTITNLFSNAFQFLYPLGTCKKIFFCGFLGADLLET